MCAFFKTLMHSSLGARVTAIQMHGIIPAFHRHAHNQACQIRWHLLYVDGTGLEDFEECEHMFTQSNHLASTTRLCTPFHRQQAIGEYFHFHDLDKHAASALEKIAINSGQLLLLETKLGTTAADYEAYHAAEVKYFQDLRKEPEEVQQTIDYIENLQNATSEQAKKDYQHLDYNIIHHGYTRPQITLVHIRYCTTHNRVVVIEEDLCHYKEERGIETQWEPESTVYAEGVKLITKHKYRVALTEVERLVVQQLLELTKLGPNYGYCGKFYYQPPTCNGASEAVVSHFSCQCCHLSTPRADIQSGRLLWQCEDSEDRDPEHGDGVPPPYWLASELSVTLMSVEYEDTAEPDPQPRLDDKDIEGVVIRDLDVKDNCLVQLMDHLSTFEDS
ncbi:hypothetical protein B0H14DRAFT_2577086 [Mycena olivaceomarginata]|nr:hypothetical protein B0H14DRAFT_2577086 [Mycena olivaceomarginata]